MKLRLIYIFLAIGLINYNGIAETVFKNDAQRQAAFRLILPDEVRNIYDQIIVPSEKKEWEEKYWKLLDPTPNTEENEFFNEFIARFEHAYKNYSNIQKPLFLDDRGKYYVKYGLPDDKVVSVGIGKAYSDNETWAYYDYNLYVDFVDQIGFGFQEVRSLLEAVTSGPSNVKILTAADLYVERETLHQKYSSFRDVLSGRSAGLPSETIFYRIADDLSSEKRLMLENAPPMQFSFRYNKVALDARLSSALFQGRLGFSRAEFYYSFPLNQLKFQEATQMPFETLVEKQLTIYNQNFEKVVQKDETLKLFARNENEINKRFYINQHTEELMPGNYHVVLKLDDISGDRMAILRSQLQVREFSDDTLMLSDIQISSRINQRDVQHRNLKPNAIQVVPYLGNIVNKSKPIYFYFEIYNLQLNDQNRSRFRVEYEVNTLPDYQKSPLSSALKFVSKLVTGKDSKETIGSSFETEGNSAFQQIYFQINFSEFPAVPTQITISAKDLESGQSASNFKRIVLR